MKVTVEDQGSGWDLRGEDLRSKNLWAERGVRERRGAGARDPLGGGQATRAPGPREERRACGRSLLSELEDTRERLAAEAAVQRAVPRR